MFSEICSLYCMDSSTSVHLNWTSVFCICTFRVKRKGDKESAAGKGEAPEKETREPEKTNQEEEAEEEEDILNGSVDLFDDTDASADTSQGGESLAALQEQVAK